MVLGQRGDIDNNSREGVGTRTVSWRWGYKLVSCYACDVHTGTRSATSTEW